ncbi:MAG TPA: hypothetical protein VGG69_08335 [Rhizomicrobium sp.]
MRAAVFGVVLAGAAANGTAAMAEPLGIAAAPRLEIPDRPHFARHVPTEDLPLLGPDRGMPFAQSQGFSIGPFRAEAVTRYGGRGRRQRLAPHYRLEGVTVLGGAIGGSLDGRGGMVTLEWHTGQQ